MQTPLSAIGADLAREHVVSGNLCAKNALNISEKVTFS
jgi:hypothetical protein